MLQAFLDLFRTAQEIKFRDARVAKANRKLIEQDRKRYAVKYHPLN